MMSDEQLLAAFAKEGSDSAFTELVRRHGGAVRAAALRQTGNDQLAEEVTQAVFLALARKAPTLPPSTLLIGWLLRATRYAAIDALRAQARQQRRETELLEMHADDPSLASPAWAGTEAESLWQRVAPLLDQALLRLRRLDRDALLLRFFENRPLAAVGAALGIPEDAARKRVHRALERLQADLARHGAHAPAVMLPALLGTHAAPTLRPEVAQSTAGKVLAAKGMTPAAGKIGLLATAVGRKFFWAGLRPWLAGVACVVALSGPFSFLYSRPDEPRPATAEVADDYRLAGFPDATVVTRFVAGLQQALAAGSTAQVARLVQFPLRVNTRRGTEFIADETQFRARYGQLMPSSIVAQLLKSPNRRLFCTPEGVMVGDGAAWIGPQGDPSSPQPRVIALNLP